MLGNTDFAGVTLIKAMDGQLAECVDLDLLRRRRRGWQRDPFSFSKAFQFTGHSGVILDHRQVKCFDFRTRCFCFGRLASGDLGCIVLGCLDKKRSVACAEWSNVQSGGKHSATDEEGETPRE